jgi:hypothetical protein
MCRHLWGSYAWSVLSHLCKWSSAYEGQSSIGISKTLLSSNQNRPELAWADPYISKPFRFRDLNSKLSMSMTLVDVYDSTLTTRWGLLWLYHLFIFTSRESSFDELCWFGCFYLSFVLSRCTMFWVKEEWCFQSHILIKGDCISQSLYAYLRQNRSMCLEG